MKYIVVFTIPQTKQELAMSSVEGKFAMMPKKDGKFKDVVCWDTLEKARQDFELWLGKLKDEQQKTIMQMAPQIVRVSADISAVN